MTVYVDGLEEYGWVIRGRKYASCHMFVDGLDLEELHALAERIGMKRAWFQDKAAAPHYDLVPSKRAKAVLYGAVEVGRREAVDIWKKRRALVAQEKAK